VFIRSNDFLSMNSLQLIISTNKSIFTVYSAVTMYAISVVALFMNVYSKYSVAGLHNFGSEI
jgi:hypothetical protein